MDDFDDYLSPYEETDDNFACLDCGYYGKATIEVETEMQGDYVWTAPVTFIVDGPWCSDCESRELYFI